MKIILFTKKTSWCKQVEEIVKNDFPEAQIYSGENSDSLPTVQGPWDLIISFLSPWIIPAIYLDQAKIAINFHPAPPKYPGTGCYNFAIYNEEKIYGATCHHMLSKVDTGGIIAVRYFLMDKNDDVNSIKHKTMQEMITLFLEIWKGIISTNPLPISDEKWERKPYTRQNLKELCKINMEMSPEEIRRRIKATYFPGGKDQPYIELQGFKFICQSVK